VLLEANYDIDPMVLAQFEDSEKRIIRTYDYERNASISTNIHALDALRLMPDYPERREVQEQILLMLLNNRKYNMYWTDKWHTSPYYATSHAILALSQEGTYLAHACRHTIDWLLHTQREDGSWGFFDRGTPEETAYVLTALLRYNRYETVDQEALRQGAVYLARTYKNSDLEPASLWIVKCLYAPYDIIRSAILAALILYGQSFGKIL
jgi:halimadienyl-diphosphate synthase